MDKSFQVISLYLLTHMGLIFFTYPANIIESLSVSHWLAIVVGYTLHVAVIAVYTKGMSYFPREDLIDLALKWRKTCAFLLLFQVAVYGFESLSLPLELARRSSRSSFLTNTPLWAIIALLLLISTYRPPSARKRLCVLGMLLAVLSIPLVAFLLILSFQNADWHYLFPAIGKQSASFSFLLDGHYIQGLFAFSGGFLFLGIITPYASYNRKKLLWASTALLPVYLIASRHSPRQMGQGFPCTNQTAFLPLS